MILLGARSELIFSTKFSCERSALNGILVNSSQTPAHLQAMPEDAVHLFYDGQVCLL